MRRLLRALLAEPSLHFLTLGLLLLLAYRAFGPQDEGALVVDAALLRLKHTQKTGEAPDEAQLARLIDEEIERELLLREARALGLAKGDPIVRRRLIQKMRFVLEADVEPPNEEELRAQLEKGQYQTPERFSFEHRFFSTMKEAQDGLRSLQAGGAPRSAPFIAGATFSSQSAAQVAKTFGPGFPEALESAARLREWRGPIRSSYGWHAVRLLERKPQGPADFREMQPKLHRELWELKRAQAQKAAIERLKKRYSIQVKR